MARQAPRSNTQTRITAGLNALTGRVTYLQRSKVGQDELIIFYAQIRQAYPDAKTIYYHFAGAHTSLKIPIVGLTDRYHIQTPAMAAGLTDHIWSVGELLRTPLIVPET